MLNKGIIQSDGPSLPVVGSLPLVGPALGGLTKPLDNLGQNGPLGSLTGSLTEGPLGGLTDGPLSGLTGGALGGLTDGPLGGLTQGGPLGALTDGPLGSLTQGGRSAA